MLGLDFVTAYDLAGRVTHGEKLTENAFLLHVPTDARAARHGAQNGFGRTRIQSGNARLNGAIQQTDGLRMSGLG